MSFTAGVAGLPGGHIAGIPIEETVALYGPALFLVVGVALVSVRAQWRRLRRGGRGRFIEPNSSDDAANAGDLADPPRGRPRGACR